MVNSKIILKEIFFFNYGFKLGEFKLKYFGDKFIVIMLSSGFVLFKSV